MALTQDSNLLQNASPKANAAESIVVGLSGGVDSAVAALLLSQQGYRVNAIFMKNWEEDDDAEYCAAAQDLEDAESICRTLNLPLRTVNFASEYWDRVFSHFLAAHQRGLTPNPDVLCNREIKFREFHLFAMDLGAEKIATGHYARAVKAGGRTQLLKARDNAKDQSYFLYAVEQSALARAMFPLGELPKPEVRKLAKAAKLPVATKRDSTGICFVGERPFKAFLSRFLSSQPGPILTDAGEQIGTHQGVIYYTIGQRQGLGIGGTATGSGAPWYVVDKDLERNVLTVVQGQRHPALYTQTLRASELHWVSGKAPPMPLSCYAKVRYRQTDQACRVSSVAPDTVAVTFKEPQWAVTPGQAVVFYDGDVCLGGGTIEGAVTTK